MHKRTQTPVTKHCLTLSPDIPQREHTAVASTGEAQQDAAAQQDSKTQLHSASNIPAQRPSEQNSPQSRVEAIPSRLEDIATRLEAIAISPKCAKTLQRPKTSADPGPKN